MSRDAKRKTVALDVVNLRQLDNFSREECSGQSALLESASLERNNRYSRRVTFFFFPLLSVLLGFEKSSLASRV